MHVLIADHRTLFRDTLAYYIQRPYLGSRISVVPDLPGMFSHLDHEAPDLLLLASTLKGLRCEDDLTRLQAAYPKLKIFMVTTVGETAGWDSPFPSSADRYFPDDTEGRTLIAAIHALLKVDTGRPAERLTPRERDVLVFLCRGWSNAAIAAELGLQIGTIKLHLRGICRKLKARNRTEAALVAQSFGLMEQEN